MSLAAASVAASGAGEDRQAVARAEHQHGLVPRQVEVEAPGRGEILDVIKAPVALRGVEELAIPVRSSAIDAVAERIDRRQAGIGAPGHVAALYSTVERESAVLSVQCVIVAARE